MRWGGVDLQTVDGSFSIGLRPVMMMVLVVATDGGDGDEHGGS